MDATIKEPPAKRIRSNSMDDEMPIDKYCDPDNPVTVSFHDVSAAAYKIKEGIQRTPCNVSQMSGLFNMKIYFKKEFLQYTGSFKERGARYTLMMLTKEQQKAGVIAASAGNHALALSYHGQDLGIEVTVVMPTVAPLMKIQACKNFGANVIIKGANISESREHAMALGKEMGFLYINGYDHPHILAGQGTMGLEIVEQVPDLDACIIPVGGGGLIAGSAVAIKNLRPHVKIYGVESERCASFTEAMKHGQPVFTEAQSTLADGLAVPTVGVNAYQTAQSLIDKMVVVKEENIALSILRLLELEKAVVEGAGATGLAAVIEHLVPELEGKKLLELEKAVVEGAGATGLAAVIEHLVPELEGKKVVIALCGGNIDTTALGRTIERGLAVDGRLVRFVVTVSDRPGGIAELTKLISGLGVSIKDIFHERAWLKSDIFAVQVKVVCETRDKEHSDELKAAITARYKQYYWGPTLF